MSGSVAPARFHEIGWAVLAFAACTHLRTGSLAAGSSLLTAIAGLAGSTGREPDVDVRSTGVTVRLNMPETGELSEDDLMFARAISDAARERGIEADLTGLQSYQIAIDAMVISEVMPFWEAVLGYVRFGDTLIDPDREGPTVWFQQMDAPRPQRNRIHLDLYLPEEQATDRVEAAIAAGGRIVYDEHAPDWWTLADPEGNEVDVAPWPDRSEET